MATFTNQAVLTYGDITIHSNIVTGEFLETLSVTKTAVCSSYDVGGTVTYVITITNGGTGSFSALNLEDDLGSYTFGTRTLYPLTYRTGTLRYFINGVLQPAPAITTGPPLEVSGISVPAGGSIVLVYEALVNEFASPVSGSTITNTVSLSGLCVGTDVTASETVIAEDVLQLTISKSLSPTTVTENSRLTYTLTVQNFGNIAADANTNAVITDYFDPILRDLTVIFNGTLWTENIHYTYNETTGLFRTVPGAVTVPAATYVQSITTGLWETTPGISTLTISGTV